MGGRAQGGRGVAMSRMGSILVAVAMSCLGAAAGSGGGEPGHEGASVYPPDALRWQEGPPSLPPGAKVAVLEGNPAKEGPFVMRVKLPDGYRLAPHTHPRPERLTVISGTFHIGMGATF